MYESFYKLHPTPFRLTPDPHFFFESDTHKRGLAYLRFAFYQREGFVVITGAPGTGQTELMLNLVNEIPRDKVTLAKIVTSNLDADDLLDLVAASFLIDPDHLSKGSLLKRLEDYFLSQSRMDKQVLLLIDEAHNLSVKSLIELSMLSNFQIDEKPLLQCFLLGQEPLEEKLRLPELVHLKQRVIASTHLEKLTPQETREYILHRLVRSGWNNNPIIRDTAFALIHFYTKGIPRRINSMCNRILLQAFLENRNDIGADLVHQIIEELQEEAAEEHVDLDVDFSGLQETMDQTSLPLASNTHQNNEHIRSTKPVSPGNFNSDNVINIPVFVRKKQSELADKNTLAVEHNTQSHTQSHTPPLENIGKQNEATTKPSEIQSKETGCEANIAYESIPDHDKQETQTNSSTVNTPNEHHPANRPSGLVDKELQFLASLSESSSRTTQIVENNHDLDHATHKNNSQQAAGKHVIIDESAYDDNGIIDDNIDSSSADINEISFNKKYHWQSIASVAIVLTAIVLSIYRWHDGGADIHDQTADIKSETFATENIATEKPAPDTTLANNSLTHKDVPDIAIPQMPIPAPVFPSTVDSQLDDAEQAVIKPADTQTDAKLAAVIPLSPNKKSSASSSTNSSTTEGISGRGKLDQQITEILEKPGIENTTATSATNILAGETEKPDTSIIIAAINIDNAVAGTATVSTNMPSTKVETKSGIEATQIANAKPELNIGSTEVEVSKSPLIGSPVAELTDNTKPGQQFDTHLEKVSIRQTNSVAKSLPTRSTRLDIVKTKAIPLISNNDLHTLLSNSSAAYEMGNLQQLVNTFAADIYSSDGSNRKQLENDYQRLFDITDTRRLAIRDVTWLKKDNQMMGNGDFQVLIREKGATSYTTYEGKISFTVAKESNNIVIKRLDYDYNN